MVIKDKQQVSAIKDSLLSALKAEHAFWSYNPDSINPQTLSDDQLIALTLRHLDLPEIRQLFNIFSYRKMNSLAPHTSFIFESITHLE